MRPLPPGLMDRLLVWVKVRQHESESATHSLNKQPGSPIKGGSGLFLSAKEKPHSIMQAPSAAERLTLPPDTISESLIRSFRFFSLPLHPVELRSLRQNILQSEKKEASTLAHAAARAKGVRLDDGAAQEYANAIDPSGDKEHRGGNNHQHKHEDLQETIKQLKEILKQKNSLSALLNRLPESDGRRWIVIPFIFFHNNIEIKLSMRLLLNDTSKVGRSRVEQMVLDIRTKKRSWSFLIEDCGERTALIRVDPPFRNSALMKKDLSRLLGPFASNIELLTETAPLLMEQLKTGLDSVLEDV